jgi:excinuclease UvrABC helicase subunit UvrB
MRIIIDIDVLNPEEVIKAHRGQIIGLLTDVIMSKQSKKKKVNLTLCQRIVEALQEELPKHLADEMVKAEIHYKIVDLDIYREEE